MKGMKRLALAAMTLVAGAATAVAQDKVEATIGADVVSQYLWRGTLCGEASVQPTLGVSYKGLSLTGWGSTEISNFGGSKEFDLTLGYAAGGFNIGVTDYWFSGGQDEAGRYFLYDAHKTNHVFEANIGYDFGPVALQWFTNFAGNDYKLNDKGELKHAYSSYVEISAPFKLGGLDWNAAVGAVPFEDGGVYGGCDGFAVTNISLKATKDVKITDSFSVPVFAQVMANPHDQKTYMAVGFSLIP